MKTPLQGIIGSAELIENGLVKQEDLPRFVGHIRREAQRLVALIGDIIRLSQLDEGDPLPWEQVDIPALCRDIAADLRDKAEKSQVSLTVEGQDVQAEGVRRLLYETVYNLCDNAIQYNVPGGSVRVTVSDAGENAVISVADTGIGILAYGDHKFTASTDGWQTITIPIVYNDRDATPIPSKAYNIMISCSSDCYGAFFCGSQSNELYVDDFEWIY